jgi:hypothetical protein
MKSSPWDTWFSVYFSSLVSSLVPPFTSVSERETRPARASVSSSWIGNLAQATVCRVITGRCNKPRRPLKLWPTGSCLEKEVTAFRRPQAATEALPLPLNYYMSGLMIYDQASFRCPGIFTTRFAQHWRCSKMSKSSSVPGASLPAISR